MKDSGIVLEARDDGMEIQLRLIPRKPPVIHGVNGISVKGADPGQASYYVSLTDLDTRGTLKLGSSSFAVRGASWFDQEFGSNQLTSEQQGWDWFSLHVGDGKDLMIYLLRLRDGTVEPASSGTLIMSDGSARHLKRSDFTISVLDHWKSPRSGGEYPSRWKIQVPSAGIDLTILPRIPNQELITPGSTGITYWEGAVSGKGLSGGRPVFCEGYVELTGYAASLGGLF